MALHELTGDATDPRGGAPGAPQIILHCCNDRGGWGSGFVVGLTRRYGGPSVNWSPERCYRDWHRTGHDEQAGAFGLGAVQFVPVPRDGTSVSLAAPGTTPRRWVANLVGQHGTRRPGQGGPAPIRYPAIETGLVIVREQALARGAEIHAPRFGAGLAGGDWATIEKLIVRQLTDHGLEVFVYTP